jgi:hypothetical protein
MQKTMIAMARMVCHLDELSAHRLPILMNSRKMPPMPTYIVQIKELSKAAKLPKKGTSLQGWESVSVVSENTTL